MPTTLALATTGSPAATHSDTTTYIATLVGLQDASLGRYQLYPYILLPVLRDFIERPVYVEDTMES